MQHVLDNCAKDSFSQGTNWHSAMWINEHASLLGSEGSLIHFAVRMGGRTCPGQIYLAFNLTFRCYAWTVLFYWLLITCVRKSISMGIDFTLSSFCSETKGVRGGTLHTASYRRDKKLFPYRFSRAFLKHRWCCYSKARCKDTQNSKSMHECEFELKEVELEFKETPVALLSTHSHSESTKKCFCGKIMVTTTLTMLLQQ